MRTDLPLAGSPERTIWRRVVETPSNRLYVIEKLSSRMYERKRRISDTLQQLYHCGLTQIAPYQPDTQGETIVLFNHALWQLCPYVKGVQLDRPAYAGDAWRGDAAAAFLIHLRAICSQNAMASNHSSFSIAAYCQRLVETFIDRHPHVAERFFPFMDHLQMQLFAIHDQLPTHFCHGDFHPLNIIWGERSIRVVIDWEFCGTKPEIYDVANLLGCLGMEDPQNLVGAFGQHLITRLRKSGIFFDESWKALPDLILAIRFAWLSEWLRKNDHAMIRLEHDYMALLMDHRQDLKSAFSRSK